MFARRKSTLMLADDGASKQLEPHSDCVELPNKQSASKAGVNEHVML